MTPFRKILFPVDFSAATTAMVPRVVEMTRRFDAAVTLLHAFDLVPDYDLASRLESAGDSKPAPVPYSPALLDIRQKRERRLEQFSVAEFPIVSRNSIIEDGDPATVIEWVARRENTDLIMMPTRGAGRFRRLLLGSITTKILHDLSCPVFTSAHQPDPPMSAPIAYRSILCAVELNPEADLIFKTAGLLAQAYGAQVCLLHVEPSPPGHDGQTLAETLRRRYEKALSAAGMKIGVEPTVRILDAPLPECLRRIAIEEAADLVVVGRGHQKGNISRIWSQLYTIIRESPCPVLSV